MPYLLINLIDAENGLNISMNLKYMFVIWNLHNAIFIIKKEDQHADLPPV